MTKKYFNPYTDFGFEIAELSHLTTAQHEQYQKSLIQYWGVKNITDTAFKDGKQEGKYEEKIEIAKGMLAEKLQLELIVKLTGLTLAEIEILSNEDFDD